MADPRATTTPSSHDAPSLDATLLEQMELFAKDNPHLIEALKLFQISNAEYERAIRALHFAPTCTTTSTQPHTR